MAYASRHPEKGSSAIALRLELPRGRIRSWLDGSAPDAVQAIGTAREYGWIDADYGDPEFRALNALVANVFSVGSIEQTYYQPTCRTGGTDRPEGRRRSLAAGLSRGSTRRNS
ncbi:hypothetical protein ACFR99_04300 [Haloarchaeobius amylolyticus]|uniref:Uncharacterized protein n=1 Tax=Haloarchaeobius amylolyticus TaxID=1198296 RepID=A0ABD6BDV1_9EURY